MPNALQLMSLAAKDAGISVTGTYKELQELQMKGEVVSSKVLPHFAKRMQEAAQKNGGLEKALDSNRVAMNRMTTSMQMAADTFFKSGLSEGLTEFFNSTAKMFKENEHTWKALGKIVGNVLKGLAFVIDNVINPLLSALGSILTAVTDLMGGFSVAAAAAFSPTFWAAATRIMKIGLRSVAAALAPIILKFTAIATAVLMIIGLLEELAEFFSPTGKRTLIGTNFQDAIKPFYELLDKVNTFFDGSRQAQLAASGGTGSENPVMIGAANLQSTTAGRHGYGLQTQPQVIQVNTHLDGQKVAETVVETPVMQEAMRKSTSQNTVRGLY